MNRVIAGKLPLDSLLNKRIKSTDFIDSFSVKSDLTPRDAAEIITDFPGWARFLVSLRNLLTSPFGISSDGPAAKDKVGIFPVEVDNERELIAGFNDKHLNFRISVISQKGRVFLSTWVHTNNIGGKMYLKAILPFHILIARDALARVRSARNEK